MKHHLYLDKFGVDLPIDLFPTVAKPSSPSRLPPPPTDALTEYVPKGRKNKYMSGEIIESEYLVVAPSTVVTHSGDDMGDGLFLTESKKRGDHLCVFKGKFVDDATHVRLCLERAQRGELRQYGIKGVRCGQVLDCFEEATDPMRPNYASKANGIGGIMFSSNPEIEPTVNAALTIDTTAGGARLVTDCDIAVPYGCRVEIFWDYNYSKY